MIALRRFLADQDGSTAMEYALIAALMVAAIVASAHIFSDEVEAMYLYVTDEVLVAIST